jgi:drug/metabolite transporter (DMT)-like permease
MWRLVIYVVAYIVTGVAAPLLMTSVSIGGGCDPKTFIMVLPSYLGMILTHFLGSDEEYDSKGSSCRTGNELIWLLSLLDLGYGVTQFGALLLAGPFVITVGSSTSLLYLSALSKLAFGRELSQRAWCSLCLIVVGLCFAVNPGLAPPASLLHHHLGQKDTSDYSNALGLLLASVAAFLHAISTILLEYLLVQRGIPPPFIAVRVGFIGSICYGLWEILYTIPDFKNKVRGPSERSLYIVASVFGILIVNSLVHALMMMKLISRLGATSTSVIKVLLGLFCFAFGHVLFCRVDEREECFTRSKAVSSLLTSIGILLYAREESRTREINDGYTEISEDRATEMKEPEL